MKKVLLKFFGANNLGDDLFAFIMLNRYKNNFYTYYSNYKPLQNQDNIVFKSNFFKRTLDKILREILNIHSFCESNDKKKYDLEVEVGGSIFIESPKKNYWHGKSKQYLKNYIPYYILGCNFGPYKSEEFLSLVKNNIFSKAEDVCFREKASYDLFSSLKSVRYAQDIVFTLDTSKIIKKNSKKVIISVIDAGKKVGLEYKEKYEEKIIEIINFFEREKYKISLMSFCKREGDEEAINSILSKIDSNLKEKIEIYNYHDNINEALNYLADSRVIVGSRFHANILGLVLEKKIIPIAYSDKTVNTFNDLEFSGKIIDIRHLEDFNFNQLKENLNYEFDITNIKKNAEKQFEKLDKVLEKKN